MKSVKCKEKEQRTVVKADRNLLVRIITAYEFGQMVNLPEILCSEIMPVPLALAELNGLLNSGDKSLLKDRLVENMHTLLLMDRL